MRRFLLFAAMVASACTADAPASSMADDEATLLSMHSQTLAAHLARDAGKWTALEADTVVVGNRGSVFTSARADRLAMRQRYFGATRFSVYRDISAPVIKVSQDGSLGWLLANVEVIAHPLAATAGAADSTHTIWAWVELYEKRQGRWVMTGNVSNERPGGLP